MSDEAIDNFNLSEDEKKNLIDDASVVLDEYNMSDNLVELDDEELTNNSFVSDIENVEINNENENIDENNIESNTENENIDDSNISVENTAIDIDESINEDNDIEKNDSLNVNETENETKSEPESEIEIEIENEIETDEESEIKNHESDISDDLSIATEDFSIASKCTVIIETENEIVEKEKILDIRIPSISDIEYSNEEVQFDIKKSTISIVEGIVMATGLKNDRKNVKPNRSINTFGVSPNSINHISYMRDGIKAI